MSNSAFSRHEDKCVATTNIWHPLYFLLPSIQRFLQCGREFYDTCDRSQLSKDASFGSRVAELLRRSKTGDTTHIWNMLKYTTAFWQAAAKACLYTYADTPGAPLGLFTAIFWIFASMEATWKWWWDTHYDWGLQINFLRPRLPALAAHEADMNGSGYRPFEANHMFPPRVYYAVTFLNFLLRWITPLLSLTSPILGINTGTCQQMFEVLRRCVWNIMSVETKHLMHCNEHRARFTRRLENFDRTRSSLSLDTVIVSDTSGKAPLFLSGAWLDDRLATAHVEQENEMRKAGSHRQKSEFYEKPKFNVFFHVFNGWAGVKIALEPSLVRGEQELTVPRQETAAGTPV
jgi:hypothetical protein